MHVPPPSSARRLVAVALVLALAAVACDTGNRPSPSASVAATPASTPTVAPTTSASPDPATPSAAATPDPNSSAGSFDPAGLTVELESVVDIPGAPLAIAAAQDDSGRLFITERGGRVWIVRDGERSEQPFLDIATRVTAGGESGLLGFAIHPDYPDDPRIFVYYTNRDRDQVVSEFQVIGSEIDQADPGTERQLLVMDDFAGNHNGGALDFGPDDGFLYISTGDGGGGGDPQKTGQRLDTLLGKILRIDVDADGDALYTVPADNPFVGEDGALPEIWHLGLRNPWRFSFDPETGDQWIGDVGQGQWEEIDVARGGEGGRNFGWSVTEGRHCYGDEGCTTDGITPPVTEYSHDFGCSVTGGVVYRGAAYPALRGAYLFADFCSGTMWAIDATADTVETPTVVAETGRSISAFGTDVAGEIYATDLAGELLRLVVR
jgi:glucose/arabinose dehydrogenase